jgi:hypothetical protein
MGDLAFFSGEENTMRFILVVLLAFMSSISLAQNKRVIDYYQQAMSDYQQAISDLKAARATIKAENEAVAKEAAKIDALIAQYESALKTTIQALVNDYQARLQQIEEAYVKGLATSKLADLAQAAKLEIKALSDELKGSFSQAQVVFNSVANEQGANAKGDANTLAFWQIPYQDRFKVKGIPALHFNYYNPTLYQSKGPATYVDVVEDLEGNVAMMMTASADGIDPKTMKMINPKFLEGQQEIYNRQFASGWSSHDYDGDTWSSNCATDSGKITQHYGDCWYYSLGYGSDSDNHWGPHKSSTRVRRITRYVIF